MKPECALCWIRRDLRLEDHAALAEATHRAQRVAVVFVFDTTILDKLEDKNDRRVTFIHQSLRELDESLQKQGSSLVVLHGDPVEEIPALAKKLNVQAVFTARDYEPQAIRRDEQVRAKLLNEGCALITVKDQVIFEKDEALSPSGQPYKVFTPYSKTWLAKFQHGLHDREHRPDFSKLWPEDKLPHPIWTLEKIGFTQAVPWTPAGQQAAQNRLNEFLQKIEEYASQRDFPAMDATSTLSVHLRFGTLSIRQCMREAVKHRAHKWQSELIWREFYQQVLYHFPRVPEHPFQPQYEKVDWPGSEEDFQKWCEGQTGYPIVDAAMRCLNATGWMHNRLRMVVASFLTKHLLVDYRWGEAYFAKKLLDFDLASNNGGWQWAASTGVDPQPYFRIFNPYLQSKKFDPKGDFIRAWLPELALLTGKTIHAPQEANEMELTLAGVKLGADYPLPIVPHEFARNRALTFLQSIQRTAR